MGSVLFETLKNSYDLLDAIVIKIMVLIYDMIEIEEFIRNLEFNCLALGISYPL